MATPNESFILIVEDDETESEKLRAHLEKKGISARVAKNAMEALRIAQEAPPALILADIMLPGMNGFKLVKLFRVNTSLKDVPIIVFTVLNGAGDMKMAENLGINDYFVKPVNYDKLMDAIRRLLVR